jgi:ABC-type Na+ efflux pump permease subunit
MKAAVVCLRLSALALVLMGAAHLFGHFQSLERFNHPDDARTRVLVDVLRGYTLTDPLKDRSIADLYLGFSLTYAITSILFGAAVLAVAGALCENRRIFWRLAALNLAGVLPLTITSLTYFIVPPTVFYVPALILALVAAWRSRPAYLGGR